MKNVETIPASIVVENRLGKFGGAFLIIAVFVLICLPWASSLRELFRAEGLYATCASEYIPGLTLTAHGIAQDGVFPLYPALTALLVKSGLPMESAMRLLSLTMLTAWALLAAYIAAERRNYRAGLVTFGCCLTTLFTFEKGVNGGPETMTAFFLLAAQQFFFHHGSRRADWNKAWIKSLLFMTLAFLSGGFMALVYFIFPLFFFRRPLSLKNKLSSPGLLIGVVIVVTMILAWVIPTGSAIRSYASAADFSSFSFVKYFIELFERPLTLPFRLLPWSLIGWMPFCVALQAIDPTPVFSRYLRTLFFSTLLLAAITPGRESAELFYVIGPWAIMTGLNYDLGIRRYGRNMQPLLGTASLANFFFAVLIMIFYLLPDSNAAWFGDTMQLSFRDDNRYMLAAAVAITLLTLFGIFFQVIKTRAPIWSLILMLAAAIGIFFNSVQLPYRFKEYEWRKLGKDIASALPDPPEQVTLYKYEIDGMYSGLFYTGAKVLKLKNVKALTAEKVYIVSPGVPGDPARIWISLLPQDYTCQGNPVSLWRGERLPPEREK